MRRLREPAEPVARFMDAVEPLGDRLGPVLLQLPPRMACDADALDAVLARFPAHVRLAVEPRDPSWFVPAVRRVLERRGAALCLADRSGLVTPDWRTADWGYVRFHEGRAAPRPCYGRAALAAWARRLADSFSPADDVFAFFNNDTEGCAPRDARRFAARVAAVGLSPTRVPGPRETPVGGSA